MRKNMIIFKQKRSKNDFAKMLSALFLQRGKFVTNATYEKSVLERLKMALRAVNA